MSNHQSFVIWHIETLLIPCGDSKRIHDVLKYIRERVRVQFHNLLPCYCVFNYLYLLRTCCYFQSMETGNGLYSIYKLISNRFGHFHKFCGNFPLSNNFLPQYLDMECELGPIHKYTATNQ